MADTRRWEPSSSHCCRAFVEFDEVLALEQNFRGVQGIGALQKGNEREVLPKRYLASNEEQSTNANQSFSRSQARSRAF
jgi:hypothetical protein